MKFGIVRFPGSCDDIDALGAAARVGSTELLWHTERDLKGVDAIIVPGGFSYGDYLRPGAIARFSPVMEAVARVRRRRVASCSGSATAFRCSARPACCPARCCPTPRCASSFARSRSRSWPPGHPFTATCAPGERLSIPVKHTTGRYYAPDDQLDALEASGQVLLRYAPGENPNGSLRDIAGVCNEDAQRLRPHAPPRARRRRRSPGPTDGLKLLESMAAHGALAAA